MDSFPPLPVRYRSTRCTAQQLEVRVPQDPVSKKKKKNWEKLEGCTAPHRNEGGKRHTRVRRHYPDYTVNPLS